MRKDLFGVLALLVGSALFAGCTTGPEGTEEHYIKLSDAVCTFTEDGGETQVIDVRANPEWSFESGASWLKVSEGEGSTLVVSADPNTDGERSAEITLQAGEATASIRVYQLGFDRMNARYRYLEDLNHAVMSPSGKYVGGFITGLEGENDFTFTAVIIDLESDERVEIGPYPESLMGLEEAEVMTDQGTLYISDYVNGGCVAFELDGTYYRPEAVPGGYGPTVMQSVSADGSVFVGYAEGDPVTGCMYAPVKYVDGVGTALPLPEKSFRDEEWWAGVMVRGMSADGSVAYGSSWENYDYGMVWWDRDGNVDWVGSDLRKVTTVQREDALGNPVDYNLVDGMICWANQTQISPDGTWIAGTYRTEEFNAESNTVTQVNYPAFFNTETRTTTVFDEYVGYVALHVTDEGLGMIGLQGLGGTSGSVVDVKSKTLLGSMSEWIQERYGIYVSGGVLTYVTPDAKSVFGYTLEIQENGQPYTVYWYIAPPLN